MEEGLPPSAKRGFATAAAAALKRNDWGSFILSFPSPSLSSSAHSLPWARSSLAATAVKPIYNHHHHLQTVGLELGTGGGRGPDG